MHLDVEYLGTSDIQAILIHDNAGGDDLDIGGENSTKNVVWDTATGVDSDFTFTEDTDSITINTDGLYHIGYTTWVQRNVVDDRFEYTSELLIDDFPTTVCLGSGYSRGVNGAQDSYHSAAESSCYVELTAGEVLKVRVTKTSDSDGSNVANTVANRVSFTAQNMDDKTPRAGFSIAFSESLSLDDTVLVIQSVSLTESLGFSDVVETTNTKIQSLSESLSLSDDVDDIVCQSTIR